MAWWPNLCHSGPICVTVAKSLAWQPNLFFSHLENLLKHYLARSYFPNIDLSVLIVWNLEKSWSQNLWHGGQICSTVSISAGSAAKSLARRPNLWHHSQIFSLSCFENFLEHNLVSSYFPNIDLSVLIVWNLEKSWKKYEI